MLDWLCVTFQMLLHDGHSLPSFLLGLLVGTVEPEHLETSDSAEVASFWPFPTGCARADEGQSPLPVFARGKRS